ncbi:endonuclease III [Niastella caeni]|uniref:Endonuclease III n=1 Tax=Niastella caeni TaxID=2569763 RepID=A0A4S8HA82_9BACT|nr:endonuclease III [Niastella caeni]THU31525.1 endonuclease III [Niastella caeni]
MKRSTIDWPTALKPLLKKYKNRKHPLEAANPYQWIVMVELSAQTTDNLINQIAPEFFKAFPDMRALAKADAELLFPYISKVRNFRHKAQWLVDTAKKIKSNNKIPLEMGSLIELPGIGRKSANVIRRGSNVKPEGIIVDLHTIRVANRLGIVTTTTPEKIEKQLMELLPKNEWDAGMAMSFLGREICRPQPKCPICLMKKVCAYYSKLKRSGAVVR